MIPYSDNPYLDLLKRSLCGMVDEDPSAEVSWRPASQYDYTEREMGRDWPQTAVTMIGLKRLNNIEYCINNILVDGIKGDFIETGVWRGGACIFMRGMLRALGIIDRTVWLADSFQGFPPEGYLHRRDDRGLASQPEQKLLSVSLDEVIHNFERYRLMDMQVQFLQGWFAETLPGPVEQLSLLRLDGDLYQSTMDALNALYPLLSLGGYCIIDDWNIKNCTDAVNEYLGAHRLNPKIRQIDGHSVFWRKRDHGR